MKAIKIMGVMSLAPWVAAAIIWGRSPRAKPVEVSPPAALRGPSLREPAPEPFIEFTMSLSFPEIEFYRGDINPPDTCTPQNPRRR